MPQEPTPIGLSCPFFNGNERRYVDDCLDSSWVSTGGGYVSRFETALAAQVGADAAVACVNGTAALHIALLLAGVQPGDEVLVPTLTFIAPINTVRYAGAEPVFLDCDEYLNLDPAALRRFLEQECEKRDGATFDRVTGKRVRAVIPVHIFGGLCDLAQIIPTAREYGLEVIEDATEVLGAAFSAGPYAGRYAGTVGDSGAFSFNGNKIITCGGGGMLVAPRDRADRARYLTTQAKDDELYYVHDNVGYNYRLPALLAALGLAQLEQLPALIAAKERLYNLYREAVAGIPGLRLLEYPSYCRPNYWFFSLEIDAAVYGMDRDGLMRAMAAAKIQTRPIWKLNHTQKPYLECRTGEIVRAEWFYQRILNLPCSANLTDAEFDRVVAVLQQGGRS